MHDTALELGRAFFDAYLCGSEGKVLDVGSHDVNGSLRAVAPPRVNYVGVDMVPGSGVDLVLDDPHVFPFADRSFDAVVASSCFEHDTMFWITFLEMVRVCRTGGYIYVNSPSNGWFHQHPRDNWRFYPDAGLSLQDWAQREGFDVRLVESFVGRRKRNVWNDLVMVFCRGQETSACARISERLAAVMNLRLGQEDEPVRNYAMDTEDQQIIRKLTQMVATRDAQLAELRDLIAVYETAFESLGMR
jgi:SAM-dependent methyltransferase